MTANQADFPIEIMARSMGVSRSGFSAWQAREPSARDVADWELTDLIRWIHAASRESFGAPRIHAELADSGVHVGRKRVERLMKAAGLAGVSRRRGARTTIRDDRVRPSADPVDRNFYADEPNMLWGKLAKAPPVRARQRTTSPMCQPGRVSVRHGPRTDGGHMANLAVVLDAFSRGRHCA